jgi:hypothetical protein
MRPIVWLWLYLELYAWRGRRRRAARDVEPAPRLSPAATRGCACSVCERERAAA